MCEKKDINDWYYQDCLMKKKTSCALWIALALKNILVLASNRIKSIFPSTMINELKS